MEEEENHDQGQRGEDRRGCRNSGTISNCGGMMMAAMIAAYSEAG